MYYYNYICNCTAPHYIQKLWSVDHCNHCSHSRKHNSNHLLVHQWIPSAIPGSKQSTSSIGFLFLKLPPPPCAVLLVTWSITTFTLKYSPLIHDMVPGKSTWFSKLFLHFLVLVVVVVVVVVVAVVAVVVAVVVVAVVVVVAAVAVGIYIYIHTHAEKCNASVTWIKKR